MSDDEDPILHGDTDVINAELRRRGFTAAVFFDSEDSSLTQNAREQLSRNANLLKRYPQLSVAIEGHTDSRGTNESNIALGDRRANAVRDYLSSQGVAARLVTVSNGEERPVCTEEEEFCWSQNRRVQMRVIGRD